MSFPRSSPTSLAPSSSEVRSPLDRDRYLLIGDATLKVLDTPEPVSPLPGFLDPDPVLHALTAEAKVGKTTFAAQLGIAFAAGIAPWHGAPSLERTGVLFISAEESVGRVSRLLASLAHGLGVEREEWARNIGIIARGMRPADGLRLLQLSASPQQVEGGGFKLLQRILADLCTYDGLPFRFVVMDSASRLWDVADEADNVGVSRWMDELQRICIETGARILLIHHQGHNKRQGASKAARGASAFGAAARVNMALSRGTTDAERTLTVEGNAIPTVSHRMRVTPSASGILGVFSQALTLADEVGVAMPLNKPMSANSVAHAVLRLRGSSEAASGPFRGQISRLLEGAVKTGAVRCTGNQNAAYERVGPLCGPDVASTNAEAA